MWTQILVHQCKDADHCKGRVKLSDITRHVVALLDFH